MDLNITEITRDSITYKCFDYNGEYFEIPETIDHLQAIENYWVNKQMLASNVSPLIVDDVYMNGAIKRQDYSVSTETGAGLVEELAADWPDIDFAKYPINIVGKYEAHRPPYENTSISWYNFEQPSAGLLAEYGLSADSYVYKPWYGLKFDLTTQEVLFKVVVEDQSIRQDQRPALPSNRKFFARIYYKDGSVDPMVDCYVYASPMTMKAYCDSVGITYPLPDDSEESKCWIWGIVYNIDTLEVTHVKAYIRHS